MRRSSSLRRLLGPLIITVFLLGLFFCPCLNAKASASSPGKTHSCCPSHAHPAGQRAGHHDGQCPHCDHARSVESVKSQVPSPALVATSSIALPPTPVVAAQLRRITARRATYPDPNIGPRAILRHTCVLLI
jgi:hypothetical protein